MAKSWTDENKQDWPDRGYVNSAFGKLNQDADLEIYTDDSPNISALEEYLDCGYRVAFMYLTESNDKHYLILYRMVEIEGEVIGYVRDLTMGNYPQSIRLDNLHILHINVAGYF